MIELKYNLEGAMHTWIEDNPKGRFHVGKTLGKHGQNIQKVGFEEVKNYLFKYCPFPFTIQINIPGITINIGETFMSETEKKPKTPS